LAASTPQICTLKSCSVSALSGGGMRKHVLDYNSENALSGSLRKAYSQGNSAQNNMKIKSRAQKDGAGVQMGRQVTE
jgi:hypothetical protein